jgi:hypothetical protein
MPKWPRWVWRCYGATFAAVAAFVVCSFLPMWEISYPGWTVCWSPPQTLWGMIADNDPGPSDGTPATFLWERPVITTAVARHIAAIVGFFWGGVRREVAGR